VTPAATGAATGTAAKAALAGLLPTLRAYAIPMRNKFRGITVREGALLLGPAGWGEFSPFAEYGPAMSSRWLASAIEAATAGWPAPVRSSVGVNVTVPAVGPELAHQLVAGSGCRTAKVKVAEPGQPESADLARVQAVRDAIGPAGRIRVDANGGWDVPTAARLLTQLVPDADGFDEPGRVRRLDVDVGEQSRRPVLRRADAGPAGRPDPPEHAAVWRGFDAVAAGLE